MTLHVIPVPSMLTPEQAWQEIADHGGLLPEHVEARPGNGWALVETGPDGTRVLDLPASVCP